MTRYIIIKKNHYIIKSNGMDIETNPLQGLNSWKIQEQKTSK